MPERVKAATVERGQHCPFLNRADDRCSMHFRLDQLDKAFDHCFDRYPACAVYQQLLLERRVRRAEAAVLQDAPRGWIAMGVPRGSRHAPPHHAAADTAASSRPASTPLVQLTVANRHPLHAA
jgi:hypothetical protein